MQRLVNHERMTQGAKLVLAGLLLLPACDFSGDFLFPAAVDGIPGIVHLGNIEPIAVIGEPNAKANIAANTVFGEVGPTGDATDGGVTFTFTGTGGAVCIWVDPELLTWNQSVNTQNPAANFHYPDNLYDDGDLDLFGGLSVYYQGSPGETVGDFTVRWEDALGNQIPIDQGGCVIRGYNNDPEGHSGRGSPEFCEVQATEPGVSYTVLLHTWSTPLDDDRLGYGMFLARGPCNLVKQELGGNSVQGLECLITGEAIHPHLSDQNPLGPRAKELGLPGPNWVGGCSNWCGANPDIDEDGVGDFPKPTPPVDESDQDRYNAEFAQWEVDCEAGCAAAGVDIVPSWPGSVAYEDAFCRSNPTGTFGDGDVMYTWCEAEELSKADNDQECNWTGQESGWSDGTDDDASRCYCGDMDKTPSGGSF